MINQGFVYLTLSCTLHGKNTVHLYRYAGSHRYIVHRVDSPLGFRRAVHPRYGYGSEFQMNRVLSIDSMTPNLLWKNELQITIFTVVK